MNRDGHHFIAPDVYGNLWVWRIEGDQPVPVLAQHMTRDPDQWDAIVALIEDTR